MKQGDAQSKTPQIWACGKTISVELDSMSMQERQSLTPREKASPVTNLAAQRTQLNIPSTPLPYAMDVRPLKVFQLRSFPAQNSSAPLLNRSVSSRYPPESLVLDVSNDVSVPVDLLPISRSDLRRLLLINWLTGSSSSFRYFIYPALPRITPRCAPSQIRRSRGYSSRFSPTQSSSPTGRSMGFST